MSGSIFISYRREDTQHAAARLSDRLEHEFSRERVFFDVETLPAGVDFVEEVAKKIDACDAFVVMIGKSWLEVRDAEGRRRLDNPDDHVRVEIVRALDAKKRVFPVLVDGATMPPRKNLPDELKPLTQRNAVKLSHESFRADCDRLVNLLNDALTGVERDRQAIREAAEEAELAAEQAENERSLREAEEERRQQEWEAEQRRRHAADRRREEAEAVAKAAEHATRPLSESRPPPPTIVTEAASNETGRAGQQGQPEPLVFHTRIDPKPSEDSGEKHFVDPPRSVPSRRRFITLAAAGVGSVTVVAWLTRNFWLPKGKSVRVIEPSGIAAPQSMIYDADFDAVGAVFATASGDNTAAVWPLAENRQTHQLAGHTKSLSRVVFAPAGDRGRLLTAADDRTARIWSGDAYQKVITLADHPEPLRRGVAWSPDGSRIATGGGRNLHIWEASTGKLIARSPGHQKPIWFAAYSRLGRFCVTISASSEETAVRIWHAETGAAYATLLGHTADPVMADFSPKSDESLVTVSYDNTALLWDLSAASSPRAVLRHDGPVVTGFFSPNGWFIVTASDDHTAGLWDAGSGKRFATLEGHDGKVTSARFSADGSMVVTASDDHSARLWNGVTGEPLAVFIGHNSLVDGAKFSPDSRTVLTWSFDKTARVWEIPAELRPLA
jgi:WD40 repeat protein